MEKPKWTTTPPDKEGYYWFQDSLGRDLVSVTGVPGDFYCDGFTVSFQVPTEPEEGTEWSYIPEPE